VVAFVAVSCSKSEQYDRPNDPWVFRSVLDSIPRVVTFALDKDLWVAYSAQNASMYKAWKGRVDFDGAVYTTQHGPQPTTVGDAWFENSHQEPWRIKQGGKEIKPKVIHYKGHRFQNGHAHLKYELELNDGQLIKITEQPEVVKTENGIGLERTFSTTNVPAGVDVGLYMNVGSVAFEESVQVKGGEYGIGKTNARKKNRLSSIDIDGFLTLASNGKTVVTTNFVNKPMVDHPKKKYMKEEAKVEEHPGYTLIAQNDCKTCHNPYRQTIGPAYIAVARRYKNNG
jgi:cytochrome c